MLAARQEAEESAAEYRRITAATVESLRAGGVSLRECARRIGIAESALRDLLRPSGTPRKSRRRRKPTNEGTAYNE